MAVPTKRNVVWLWTLFLFALLGQCQSLYDNATNVIAFTKSSDMDQVLQSDGVWMIQFYSSSSQKCQDFSPLYQELSGIFKGIVNIAAVDVSTDAGREMASAYDTAALPSLYIFGVDKKKPEKYKGPHDAQTMAQTLMNSIVELVQSRGQQGQQQQEKNVPSKVVMLTADNFETEVLNNPMVSMVAFIAPWCGHCKKLLPEWHQAAERIHGEGAFLGIVDATVEESLAAQYRVQGFPTIKVFPGGIKTHADAKDYPGERSAAAIVQFILGEVDRTGVPKEIPELTSMEVLNDNCQGPNHICVIAALPHILDSQAAGRNKYRDLLAKVAKHFRGSAYQFLWFEGGSQLNFEQALELTFGYPAVVALSLDRQAYAVQRGSFSEKAITSFLHSITTGRQQTIKLPEMPQVVTVEPWDGKDGTPLEEEPPLSEIMGWDDDDDEENEL